MTSSSRERKKAEREGDKSATLFSLRAFVFGGPLFNAAAGAVLVLNPRPWAEVTCLLLLASSLYLGINWIWYTHVCRIASLQLMPMVRSNLDKFRELS